MRRLLLACLCLFALSSCSRFATEGFDTYFWTSTPGIKMQLYIDGESKGGLPYLEKAPDCGNDTSRLDALKIFLPSGRYSIEVKDAEGNHLFSEKLNIWKRGGSVSLGSTQSTQDGGARRTFKGNCLIEELFYTQVDHE